MRVLLFGPFSPSLLVSHVLLVWIFRPDLRGTAGGGALTTSPQVQGETQPMVP